MTMVLQSWIHDFGDFRMVLDKSDLDLSRQVKMLGKYSTESFEKTVLENYLKKDHTMLDVGANIGFYSLLARSKVGPEGKVFAFEASKENADLIGMSIRENSFENITVVNVAVSNKIGIGFLYMSPYYNSEHSLFGYHYSSGKNNDQRIPICLETIDNFLENKIHDTNVDLIKMDIEGSESMALEGMTKTISHNDEIALVTEFWPQGFKNSNSEPKEFLENLDSLGFMINHIDEYKQKLYPVTIHEMLQIAEQRQTNPVENTKEIQPGGWYTNLLCVKSKHN